MSEFRRSGAIEMRLVGFLLLEREEGGPNYVMGSRTRGAGNVKLGSVNSSSVEAQSSGDEDARTHNERRRRRKVKRKVSQDGDGDVKSQQGLFNNRSIEISQLS